MAATTRGGCFFVRRGSHYDEGLDTRRDRRDWVASEEMAGERWQNCRPFKASHFDDAQCIELEVQSESMKNCDCCPEKHSGEPSIHDAVIPGPLKAQLPPVMEDEFPIGKNNLINISSHCGDRNIYFINDAQKFYYLQRCARVPACYDSYSNDSM